MPLMSVRAYGRHRGVSHVAVLKALSSGRIRRGADGKIDSEAADRDWAQSTNQAKPLNSVSGDPKHRRAPDEPSRPTLGSDRGMSHGSHQIAGGYAAARAIRESYAARLAQLDYEQRRGQLVDVNEVRAEAFRCARTARDQLTAIPHRIAPIIAGISDPGECRRMLSEEIEKVCRQLSEGGRCGRAEGTGNGERGHAS